MPRVPLFFSLLLSAVFAGNAHAQPAAAPVAEATTPAVVLTPQQVAGRKKTLADAKDLSEEERTELEKRYDAASGYLLQSAQAQKQLVKLRAEEQNVSDDLTAVQELLGKPVEESQAKPDDTAPVDELRKSLSAAETNLNQARESHENLEELIAYRLQRRRELPALITKTRDRVAALEKELAAAPPKDASALQTTAAETVTQAEKILREQELDLFMQELKTYEATAKLTALRRDLAERVMQQRQREHDAWEAALAVAVKREANRQAEQAREDIAAAPPAVKGAASRNAELAELNRDVVESIAEISQELDDVEKLSRRITEEFTVLKRRAEAADFSHAVGVLLRNHRASLPDAEGISRGRAKRQEDISRYNVQIVNLEQESRGIVDTEAQVRQALEKLDESQTKAERKAVADQMREILARQLELYATTVSNTQAALSRLVELDSRELRLVERLREQRAYIAEHVLWVRSTTALTPAELLRGTRAVGDLAATSLWADVRTAVSVDVVSHPHIWVLTGLLVVGVIFLRPQLKRQLIAYGLVAVKSHSTEFRPTLKSLAITLVIAAMAPLAVSVVGWRIVRSPESTLLLSALGTTLQVAGGVWFAFELLRRTCRHDGLAEAHFLWPRRGVRLLRRTLNWVLPLLVPLVAVVVFAELSRDLLLHNTVGRLAFLMSMTLATFGLVALLRPKSALMQEVAGTTDPTLITRTRYVWAAALVAIPVALFLLAFVGYYYTALQFGRRLLTTAALLFGLVVLRSLLTRWLLVKYRKLAILRARERREAMQRKNESAAAETMDVVEQEPLPEFQLSDVNEQSRTLIRLAVVLTFLVGCGFIWLDVLPAFGALKRFELWPSQILTDADSQPVMVTLADLLLAVGVVVLTTIAARNLPGLLELTVLSRLPFDAGARYAVSSLTRYAIFVLGTLVAFSMIGVGWSSVQWLVAAMSVGLGFGLQEIFANFVSGLILLFERPMRVGDTVTVNDLTGTVVRIRIRATTVVDWNNKELVIPNKEFVTGNLVNWTLTNPNLRVVVTVGIAYGSDTELATKLLYKVAEESPNVQPEPHPLVVFQQFGASSLDFELRFFVAGLVQFRTIHHEINMAIDQAFRKADIEIAFPQRDLHVRSVTPELLSAGKGVLEPPPMSHQTHGMN